MIMDSKILIDYLYIEGTRLYAVEKTTGAVQGPPRIFLQEIEVTVDGSHILNWVEHNYR